MDGSGTARYGFWNWDGGIPVTSDQKAAARSSPSCRQRRTRSRASSIAKNRRSQVQ
jgi:hypothetical protein